MQSPSHTPPNTASFTKPGFAAGSAYGWVMVVIAALAMLATLPGRTHGLGMITERLLDDPAFGIDRVAYSDINLWATLLGGLFCLPCGWLIDRFGLRTTLTVTVAALAAVVLWMTKLSGSTPLFVAILLTRGFGQSALSVISITMVGKWFRGRVSIPMGVYSFLMSIGFAAAFRAAAPMKDADWRVLWTDIGWALVGFLVIAALFTRDPQEDERRRDSVEPTGTGFTLQQAMQTPAFWLFGLSISIIALIGSGISLFNESVLKQQGFSNEIYYQLSQAGFLIGLATQVPVGFAGYYLRLNWLQGVGLALLGACLMWLPSIHTEREVWIYAVGTGVSGGITTVLFFTVWSQAYGRKHLGQIQAVAQMLTVLFSALGPKLFAETFARTGSYTLIFQSLAMIVLGLAGISLFIRVPSPEEAEAPEAADALATAPALEG
jgi:MFS family permease